MLPRWFMISHDLAIFNTSFLRTLCREIVKGSLSSSFYLILKQHNLKEVKGTGLLFINDILYEQKAKIQEFSQAAKGN